MRTAKEISHVPIRKLRIVIDAEDVFAPELTVEEFIKLHKTNPEPPRYRIVNIEVVTCPEDQQPVLVTECGRCSKFIRRFGELIACWKVIIR